jgi:hypothetical protein
MPRRPRIQLAETPLHIVQRGINGPKGSASIDFPAPDMPRRPRILLAETPLHIVQRGINREPCFFAVEDYHCYLHWLEKSAHDWR